MVVLKDALKDRLSKNPANWDHCDRRKDRMRGFDPDLVCV
jgi:hypothetical protein